MGFLKKERKKKILGILKINQKKKKEKKRKNHLHKNVEKSGAFRLQIAFTNVVGDRRE
jgi:hypothetical protein